MSKAQDYDDESGDAGRANERGSSGAVRSVERCIDILDYLTSTREPKTLSDIARQLDAPKSTVLTILRTLAGRGLVAAAPGSKAYAPGLRLARYAASAPLADLGQIAQPYLRQLADATGETATLGLYESGAVFYGFSEVGAELLQFRIPLGIPRPLHATAAGKLALACMSEADLDGYIGSGLERITPKTVVDPVRLRSALQLIRKQGYAITREEGSKDLFGVAAPIRGASGGLAAAVGLAGPMFRLKRSQKVYVEHVVQAAHRISEEMRRYGDAVVVPDPRLQSESR